MCVCARVWMDFSWCLIDRRCTTAEEHCNNSVVDHCSIPPTGCGGCEACDVTSLDRIRCRIDRYRTSGSYYPQPEMLGHIAVTQRRRLYILTVRECGVVMHLVASVCLRVSVCVCPVRAITFDRLNPENSFLIRRYIFSIPRSSSYIKVIGSRSRSQK